MHKKIMIIIAIVACLVLAGGLVLAQEDVGVESAELEDAAEVQAMDVPGEAVTSFDKAKIISIDDKSATVETELGETIESYREIRVEMLSGSHKGEEIAFEDSANTNPFGLEFEIGQKLLMYVESFSDGHWQVAVDSHYRVPTMLWLVALFFLFLLMLAGWRKGLKTILSLLIAIVLIFKVLVPQVAAGHSALAITFIIVAIVTAVTLALVGGFNRKTLAAIFGTISGVLVAFFVAYIFSNLANLVGLSTEEERLLAATITEINPKNLCLAGIVIGALGAAMDVGISIASSIKEVKEANQGFGFSKLFSSGMNVGRDIIGTMSNTLIFAYVGVALPTILLYNGLGESWIKFINFNFIADEMVRSIGGSIGLIAVIPLTALFAAYFYHRTEEGREPMPRPGGIVKKVIGK